MTSARRLRLVRDGAPAIEAAAEMAAEPPVAVAAPATAAAPAAEPTSVQSSAAAESPAPAPPVRPKLTTSPGAITPDDPFAEAGRKAIWPHAQRLLKFEASLSNPSKTDDLKRYRVATRRIRAALRLFAAAWPDRKVRALRDGLGELGRTAGAVRDLDVRIADLERWGEAVEELRAQRLAAVAPLRLAWEAERAAGSAALLARIETRRHLRLLRDLVELAEGEWKVTDDGARTVRGSAASRIWRAFETLREEGALVRWADLEAMHEVRIDAKRLRYSLEFLGVVLSPGREALLARLVALQDHLGAINDAAVTSAAVRAFLGDRRIALTTEERDGIARYAADRDRDLARLRRSVGRPWRPIAAVAFARRLGRVVVIA